MEDSRAARRSNSYTTRLDRTLKVLQDRVKEQEALLEELRASIAPVETEPSTDPKAHLLQLRSLTAAYKSLTPAEPWLPPRDSPLPALIALRTTDKTITETRDTIVKTEVDLKETTDRLEKEKADLSDAKLIQTELEARISSLQVDIDERTQKSPSEIARDMIQEVKKKQTNYDARTDKLMKAFDQFIDDKLAAMLAIEELGGPIVGDVLDVNEEMLEGAFSTQGKPKRAKPSEDKRQRRIDQIWGPRPEDNQEPEEPWDEKRAAATEMRDLTEQLLNSLMEAEGTGPGAYVELKRESAAARFLVRSKVAQFHPNDARKLRLVDFGGEIDD
ncbi:uncharacterized protein LY89DRAFT_572230 [Mollisia scopiformis]|uniref:Uncharacterized protein n=1 Tax=Mollisia scopiformis TaxID=149040 RepID=A0A194XUY4_MOLSC|nr:uncharacterized protein LY89DRAFT_572230 [Mollisia scopiformis]KUJ23946.1 hypothetical protein LY89DRAFT_572230 [Mollisia scopiformis]